MLAGKANGDGEIDGSQLAELMQDPAVLGMLQKHMSGLEGHSSGLMESLPKAVINRVKAMKQLQAKHVLLEVEYQAEIQKLDQKFSEKYGDLYTKRNAIINGSYEPTEEECVWDDGTDDEEDDEKVQEVSEEGEESSAGVTGVPNFWLTCLQNHPAIADNIEDADVAVLRSLTDIRLAYSGPDEKSSFTFSFHFSENDYFTDSVLTKTYLVKIEPDENELIYEGPSYTKATGCKIQWKPGQNVTKKTIKKTQRRKGGKNAGQTRTVVKEEDVPSFFHFFDPPVPPANFDEIEEPSEEDIELHNRILMDFELGDILKDKVVPNAVMWFTGEALEYEDDDDDDDEGDEDEDEDSDDGTSMRKLMAGGGGGAAAAGSDEDPDYDPAADAEKPAECKQQ